MTGEKFLARDEFRTEKGNNPGLQMLKLLSYLALREVTEVLGEGALMQELTGNFAQVNEDCSQL